MREIISDGNELVAKAAIEVGCRFLGAILSRQVRILCMR